MFHDWFLTTSAIWFPKLSYYESDFIDIGDYIIYIQSLTAIIV